MPSPKRSTASGSGAANLMIPSLTLHNATNSNGNATNNTAATNSDLDNIDQYSIQLNPQNNNSNNGTLPQFNTINGKTSPTTNGGSMIPNNKGGMVA